MAQLGTRKWCIEAGVLKRTHNALIACLAGYGFVTSASHAFGKLMNLLDAKPANIAARRMTGVHRSARLEVLMPAAALIYTRNLYIQQCGSFFVRALKVCGSPLVDWAKNVSDRFTQ